MWKEEKTSENCKKCNMTSFWEREKPTSLSKYKADNFKFSNSWEIIQIYGGSTK